VHWGRHTEDQRAKPVPSDTQQRARPFQPIFTFHAEAVLVKTFPEVPNSQRSTHELTVQNICLQSVLCSLERR